MLVGALQAKALPVVTHSDAPVLWGASTPQKVAVLTVGHPYMKTGSRGDGLSTDGVKLGWGDGVNELEYSKIAELKTAGRSDEEIARQFSLSLDKMIPHIDRAMSRYHEGKLMIDSGTAVQEARRKGAERGREFNELVYSAHPKESSQLQTRPEAKLFSGYA